MSTSINSNYHTLVQHSFHTTDADGNKVMDKMSKEETMRSVNEISAQYDDSVIVEFSGDGMAALGAYKGMDLPEEHKEIPDWMITHNEAPEPLTKEQLAEMNVRYGDDTEAQMRVIDPEAYNEYQRIRAEGLAGGTENGFVAGARYMLNWLTTKAKTDPGWVERANAGIEKETTAESKLSTNAQKYLESLRKQYGDFDFFIAGQGADRNLLLSGSAKKFSVIFDIGEFERMTNDKDYAFEKLRERIEAAREKRTERKAEKET